MKTFHRGISSVIENEHFYLGILKGYTVDVFNLHIPKNIDLLLSNKIIKVRDVAIQPNSENINVLKSDVVLGNKLYSIDCSLIEEIIVEIGSYIQSNTDEILSDVEKIEKELCKLERPNDKIKKLKDIKGFNIDLIQHFQDYLEYKEKKTKPRIDVMIDCFFRFEPDFLSSYVLYGIETENLLVWYCHCRKYLDASKNVKYKTKMLDDSYDVWYNWYSKGYIIEFCEKQIEKIKNKTQVTKKKVTPFKLIVIVDHFRSNYGQNSFKEENIKSFLLNFENSDADNNFKVFKKLMECSQEDYDNESERARLISSVTKTNTTNIRKKISKYSNSKDKVIINEIISDLTC
jgi:hypothetical protein